jgi:hypothetical protein
MNSLLSSKILTVTVGKSKTFFLHCDLVSIESEVFSKALTGSFKEAKEYIVEKDEEDPDLFGFFVEYLYRDQSILSRNVQHYSEFVTLARLYAMGERLLASKFQSCVLWRFCESLGTGTHISEESICELLQIACTGITERVREDPMRSQIFWYAAYKITSLQNLGMFRQLLSDIDDLGKQLTLWVNKSQPKKVSEPPELQYQRFGQECEYNSNISFENVIDREVSTEEE